MLEDFSAQPTLAALLRELGVPNLKVLAMPEDLVAQEGTVTFPQAVRAAIVAFCTDEVGTGNSYDTAYFSVKENPGDWGLVETPTRAQIEARLRKVLADDATATLVLLSEKVLEIEAYRFPPEMGESLTANWVVRVIAPKGWGQLTWAIIDRTGMKQAYCYSHD